MSENAQMREWSAYELEIAVEVFAEFGEEPRPATSHVAIADVHS